MKPRLLIIIVALLLTTSYMPLTKDSTANAELTATVVDAEGKNWGGAYSNNRTYNAELLRGGDVIDSADVGTDGSVSLVDETIGIQETQGNEIIQNAYPNPFGNVLVLPINNTEAIENVKTEVYDMKGSLVDVIEKEMNGQRGTVKWNAADKPTGTYILRSTIRERDGDHKTSTSKAVRINGGSNAQVNNWNTPTKDSKLEYTLRVSGPNMETTEYPVEMYEGETTQLGEVIAEEQPVNIELTGSVENQFSEPVNGNAYLIRDSDTLQTDTLENGSYHLQAQIGGNDYNKASEYDVAVNGETFNEEKAENVTITNDTTTIHFTVEEEQPITLTGFIYDLDNKYDENWEREQPPGLDNMIVYLQSEGIENHVRTNNEGRFTIERDSMNYIVKDTLRPNPPWDMDQRDYRVRVTDTLVIAGNQTDLSDTTHYFFKTPINKIVEARVHLGSNTIIEDSTYVNKIEAGEINEITAFNDTTGIPMIQREYFEETNRDLMEYMQYVNNIAHKYTSNPVWEHIATRVPDEELPITVDINTEESPAGDEYPENLYYGYKNAEAGRFTFTLANSPDSAFTHFIYDNDNLGQGFPETEWNESGPYISGWTTNFSNNGTSQNIAYHLGAHEAKHKAFLGNTTDEILDQYYLDPLIRANNGVPLESPPSEHRATVVKYNLEINPKFYQYTKTLVLD